MKKNILCFFILFLSLFTLTGCTKQLIGADGKVTKMESTGQNLPSNIVCAPTDKDIIEKYNKTINELKDKYKKDLEAGDISKKDYKKKTENLLNLDKLPACSSFTPASGGYEGIWTTIFVKPLCWVLIKLGSLIGNYGIAIILATLLIRLIMYPITQKPAKQSELLKKAKPDLDKIEKKYRNRQDQESMMLKSQEMMNVYKKYNINPLSGCLFAFIQFPLFFAFFESLYRLPVLFEDSALGFQMSMTPINGLSSGGWYYLILPLLVGFTTYFSFRLNKGASLGEQEKTMNTMMNIMMVMITVMSFTMSSAIIFYWITNSAFTIIQNLIVKRSN